MVLEDTSNTDSDTEEMTYTKSIYAYAEGRHSRYSMLVSAHSLVYWGILLSCRMVQDQKSASPHPHSVTENRDYSIM